jgi:hypothetical protein
MIRDKTVIVPISYKDWDRIIEKNNNLEYSTLGETKTMDNYIEELHGIFPEESVKFIRKVIRYGMVQLKAFICDKVRVSLCGNKCRCKIGSIVAGRSHERALIRRRISADKTDPDG